MTRSPSRTQAQASPEYSAPPNGTFTPPARSRSAGPEPTVRAPDTAPTRATTTVPRPGTLCRSKSSARRAQVPSPAPREPVVVKPSRSAADTSAIPGPWSTVAICTRGAASRPAGRKGGATTSISTWPPPACLSRLVASSVATSAAVEVRCSSRPARAAACSAATLASRTRVESCTGTSHTRGIRTPHAGGAAGPPRTSPARWSLNPGRSRSRTRAPGAARRPAPCRGRRRR